MTHSFCAAERALQEDTPHTVFIRMRGGRVQVELRLDQQTFQPAEISLRVYGSKENWTLADWKVRAQFAAVLNMRGSDASPPERNTNNCNNGILYPDRQPEVSSESRSLPLKPQALPCLFEQAGHVFDMNRRDRLADWLGWGEALASLKISGCVAICDVNVLAFQGAIRNVVAALIVCLVHVIGAWPDCDAVLRVAIEPRQAQAIGKQPSRLMS